MKFWAIAYKYQEDVFYDVVKCEDTMDLTGQCLLPSLELANQIIEDMLEEDYVAVEIEIETLSKQGVMTWTRGSIEEWDQY